MTIVLREQHLIRSPASSLIPGDTLFVKPAGDIKVMDPCSIPGDIVTRIGMPYHTQAGIIA